jgi:hypothetical protein
MSREASSNGPGAMSRRCSRWCAADQAACAISRCRPTKPPSRSPAITSLAFYDALIVAAALEAGCGLNPLLLLG